MAYISLKKENPRIRHTIVAALRRRALVIDAEEEENWEVHGPHSPETPFPVYIGYVTDKDNDCFCVAITLHGRGRGVFKIDASEDWYKQEPEKKIEPVK